jgi:AcrR family transcriptional regulator
VARRRTTAEERVPRGRPRTFDCDLALGEALQVFWKKGYAGASLSDLTKAMGINRPSLYAAYGDKEQLFRKALDKYAGEQKEYLRSAMAEPRIEDVVRRVLLGAADSMCAGKGHPAGCLLVQGAMASGREDKAITGELVRRRCANEVMIRDRMQRAQREGELPADADPAALAKYIATVTLGMAVQAASGATFEQLREVAETAMKAWPRLAGG